MITPLLRNALEPVVQRHRTVRRLTATTLCLAVLAVLALAWPLLSGGARIPSFILIALGGIAWWRAAVWAENWNPDYRAIARRIEQHHPGLHTVLLTAVEQKPDPATGRLHFLQQRVLSDAAAEARKQPWIDSIPHWKLNALRCAAVAAFLAAVLPTFHLPALGKARTLAPAAQAPVEVSPGNVALERGSGLVVLATFHRDVPGEATLVIQPRNAPEQRIPLVKNLDDPVFGGGLPQVDGDLTYRVEYAGKATDDFSVKVFEHPRLERADATLRYPAYTKLAEKTVPDTRRVSAVEGTKLDVAFELNKPVKSAALVAKDGTTLPLSIEPGQPRASLRDHTLAASRTYELKLEDADGRTSKVSAQISLDALPNRRPELKIAAPKGDQRVSALQEMTFGATAWDDFGLLRSGLAVNVAGRGEQHIELGKDTAADAKVDLAHLLKLEDLGVKPDELVSWYLWAEDVGPDGQPRRTATDIYFAEVRPFEEIYRQGDESQSQQQQQQQSQAGQQAEELANSQKQIISATWNLQRAEEANTGAKKPSETYLKDEPVVRDAQAELLAKNSELAAHIDDPKSAALMQNVTREMQAALDHLKKAEATAEPLPDALSAEQAAYNALLKIAAREFQIVRQQSQQRGQQQQQRNQQQMDELEMKDEKKRYETKTEAQPMQNEQQREQLAVLNRLKELAQRQQDINERVKELQTQLQAAQTEKEKEELQRQLKRLREEEQQMLADIDETRQRMEQSPQQSEFAEQRRQLEQTRSEAQQAAQAMEQGQASQALASGTRAQRDLQQMRDELRKKASGQFNEEMRQMRTDARDLAQNQQEISEKLRAEPARQERRTLDGTGEREQLAKQLESQRGELSQLTENMKRVSEQAEAAEPLLARELYDTLRKSAQAGTGETLEKTEMLAQRGYQQQAQAFEEKARAEIEEIKSGVERAAESVLGDEAEALRQARSELDALNQELTRELARARPDLAAANQQSPNSETQTDGPGGGQDIPPSRSSEGAQQADARGNTASTSSEDRPGQIPRGNEQSRGQRGEGEPQPGEGRQGERPGEQQTTQAGEREGQGPGQNERQAQTARQGAQGQERGERGQQDSPGTQPGDQPGQEEQTAQQGAQGRQPGGDRPGQTGQREAGQAGNPQGQTAQNSRAQQPAQQPGENQQPGQQTAEGQGQSSSGQGANRRGGEGQQTADDASTPQNAQRRAGARIAELAGQPVQRQQRGGNEGGGSAGGPIDGEQAGPLTGDDFTEWSDRLRNVEEMIDDPVLRTEAARVREIAKGVRGEYKRHSVMPNWDLVNAQIRTPLAELRDRLTEELARRESKENLVPIDRDPVPTKFAERVRRYYEDLGRSR